MVGVGLLIIMLLFGTIRVFSAKKRNPAVQCQIGTGEAMTLDEIEKVYDSASEEYKFFGKDQQLATWAMMHGTKLINIAKAAKYMADRSDLHYLHAEIKDPLLQNIKLKLEELEKE